jgi:hypothetical protein
LALAKLEVLITVKAYPNPSKSQGEAACIAGISRGGKWARLYPIPFRDLDDDQKFKKYQWIEVKHDANKKKSDPRPETIRPITETIRILSEPLSTAKSWAARKDVVMPMLRPSMCDIQAAQVSSGTSLGVFRPREIFEVEAEREETSDWTEGQLAKLGQRDLLLTREKRPLQKIPFSFFYRFKCENCRNKEPHRMKIIDWELAELWRSYRRGHDEPATLEAVRAKYRDELCGPWRDPHFFTGNMQAYPKTFLILGVFWPPKTKQLGLFEK